MVFSLDFIGKCCPDMSDDAVRGFGGRRLFEHHGPARSQLLRVALRPFDHAHGGEEIEPQAQGTNFFVGLPKKDIAEGALIIRVSPSPKIFLVLL